jgi:uncharacterized membrane protein (UPF0127 family)
VATGPVNLTGGSNGKLLMKLCLLLGVVGALLAVAFLRGCDDPPTGNIQRVKINGKSFFLEIADTEPVRMKGMGQRTHIDDDGGMLFVFTTPKVSSFVMRDCPIPIDIIYLDQFGKVLASYEMKPVEPRGADEGQPGEVNQKYEERLSKNGYSSRFPTQFVIELKGGTLPSLNLKDGDKIELPLAALKSRAQ